MGKMASLPAARTLLSCLSALGLLAGCKPQDPAQAPAADLASPPDLSPTAVDGGVPARPLL